MEGFVAPSSVLIEHPDGQWEEASLELIHVHLRAKVELS